MAASKSNHIRSISLPSRSHPRTLRVEEELNKLKALEITVTHTVETICNGLISLEELYKCIDDLQALSHHHKHEKLIEDLLEKSVRLLDVCGATKEFASQCKKNVRDLQSLIRRRKGDLSIESSIDTFTSFNKKMKKDVKSLALALKQINQDTEVSILLVENQETTAAIRTLREANTVCSLVFQMLLQFLSLPCLKSKKSKWSLISRLVHKGKTTCEGQEEIMNLETSLGTIDSHIESIENGLERIFRCNIRSRSSLLNMLSC